MLLEDLIPLIYYARTRTKKHEKPHYSNQHEETITAVCNELLEVTKTSNKVRQELPLAQYLAEIAHNHVLLRDVGLLDPSITLLQAVRETLQGKIATLVNEFQRSDNVNYQQFRLQFIDEEAFLAEQERLTERDNEHEVEEEEDRDLLFTSLRGGAGGNAVGSGAGAGAYFSFNLDDLPAYEPLEETLQLLRQVTPGTTQPHQVETLRGALDKLLAYDVSDLVENAQWPELIDHLSAHLLHPLQDDVLLMTYAVLFRWMKGFQLHYQTTDLLTSLLRHLHHLLPPLTSHSLATPLPTTSQQLPVLVRAQLTLTSEALRLIAQLPQFTTNTSEAHQILFQYFTLLSERAISLTSSSSISLLLLTLTLPHSLQALQSILRHSCQLQWNLIIVLTQTGFLPTLLRFLSHDTAVREKTLCLILQIAEQFMTSEHFLDLLALLRHVSTSSSTSSAPTQTAKCEVEAVRQWNNLFLQQRQRSDVMDFDDVMPKIFAHLLTASLTEREEVLRWWVDDVVLHALRDEVDDVTALSAFTHLAKLTSSHLLRGSEVLEILRKRCEVEMTNLLSAAFRCSPVVEEEVQRLSVWLEEVSVLSLDHLLASPRVSLTSLAQSVTGMLTSELSDYRSLVLQEITAPRRNTSLLCLRVAIHLHRLVHSLSTSSDTSQLTTALLQSMCYHLSTLLPHRDDVFQASTSSSLQCRQLFFLVTSACMHIFSSEEVATEVARGESRQRLLAHLFLALMQYYTYLLEKEWDKLFLADLTRLLVRLRGVVVAADVIAPQLLSLYSLSIEQLFSHPHAAEHALTSSHLIDREEIAVTNQLPFHLLFHYFYEVVVRFGDSTPLKAMSHYLATSYLDSSEKKEGEVEVVVVVDSAFLEAVMYVPGFPYFLRLLVAYVHHRGVSDVQWLKESDVRVFIEDNVDLYDTSI
eukprot:gene13729-15132_t